MKCKHKLHHITPFPSAWKNVLFTNVQCKEVKKHKFISVIILSIEGHVSAYSEAIIRFNNFQLYETNIFHGIALLDDEISSSMFVWQYTEKKTMRSIATKYLGMYVPGAYTHPRHIHSLILRSYRPHTFFLYVLPYKKVKGKGRLWVLQHCCLEAYCTLTQMSSFIHLQRRCTHQAAWETSANEGRNYTWNLASNP